MTRNWSFGEVIRWALVTLGVLAVLAQAVPYGRSHTNPPARVEPAWDRPQTRALAVRACFECHSNETTWPWYSHVAPISWLVQRDVDEGRAALNFSTWDQPQKEAHEAAEVVAEGEMPPPIFMPLHPEARLSANERQSLFEGLRATIGETSRRGEGERRER